VAVRERRLFGWGWFLDTDSTLRHAELRVPLVDGSEAVVACLEGAARPDVAAAFPDVAHAAGSGFMLMARLADMPDASRPARFVAELSDGERHEIEIHGFPQSLQAATAARSPWRRVLEHIRARGLRSAVGTMRARSAACMRALATRLAKARLLASRPAVTVVFDHAMGGGANVYRDALVGDAVSAGMRVVLVTPRLDTLDYLVQVVSERARILCWSESSLEAVVAVLRRLEVRDIQVNDLVSFDDPLRVVDWCRVTHAGGAGLTFHLHDFHSVCPAFTLIDSGGRYCGVPSMDVCRRCLPANAANSLGLGRDVDIQRWRDAWAGLLDAADRVVVFSAASAAILSRAYPALTGAHKVEVRPHRAVRGGLRKVIPGGGAVLQVGVIGNISRPKGARIVEDIARLAAERALPLRVVVIGTLQTSRVSDGHLHIHGPYAAQELPALLERYGIDLCLMPSICPETYSYVTDEIMAMDLPLAVFDIGAPAERVARYGKGCVMKVMTAEAALGDIMRLAGRAPMPPA
jgi:glycosyltransferase involved in cell wall biosynthesis